uniref:RRM domain-containing protein n=1 Tax=Oxyrrhis marina TaxID=2969 RepID=A0A7S4LQ82_OXYMA|mmetsp:Transcript_19764/g.50158  ORF Transcript_19764/g.50158 Transcript_19764/m.50158 type:complete len:158 (-) Transcript_19764:35-508(-)
MPAMQYRATFLHFETTCERSSRRCQTMPALQGTYQTEPEPKSQITTMMICNIPSTMDTNSMVEDLNRRGFEGAFDTVVVPEERFGRRCRGYAFVNFVSRTAYEVAEAMFHGRVWDASLGGRVVDVREAREQGQDRLVAMPKGRTVKRRVVFVASASE